MAPPYDDYGRTQRNTSGGPASSQVPTGGGELAVVHAIRTAYAAAGQDVSVFGSAGAPTKMRIVDVFTDVDTANASETLTMRDAAGGGKAWISSFTKRVASGATIDIPLAHKDALYVRSHYDGITITLPDSPLPDELAIICAYANRGQLNHRIGGLAVKDIKGQDGLV